MDKILDKIEYYLEQTYSLHEADAIMRWLTDKYAPKDDIWKLLKAIENDDVEFITNYNN